MVECQRCRKSEAEFRVKGEPTVINGKPYMYTEMVCWKCAIEAERTNLQVEPLESLDAKNRA